MIKTLLQSTDDKKENNVMLILSFLIFRFFKFVNHMLQLSNESVSYTHLVIKVGAATETEMKEKKLRIEDALNATRAAVEEGIVAGGGVAYVNAIVAVEALAETAEGDEKTGMQIVARGLEAPMAQIAVNAGIEGAIVVDKVCLLYTSKCV